ANWPKAGIRSHFEIGEDARKRTAKFIFVEEEREQIGNEIEIIRSGDPVKFDLAGERKRERWEKSGIKRERKGKRGREDRASGADMHADSSGMQREERATGEKTKGRRTFRNVPRKK
ncbi:hypothetical protein K0M31_002671, partial [Melipona bicolor]